MLNIDWSQPESVQIYADWLEGELDHRCETWRMGIVIGSAPGISIGGRGLGRGLGRGYGDGIGIGLGIGNGNGIGGRGFGGTGIGRVINQIGVDMQVGNHYLVHCVDWVTVVGRCVEQVGPLTYRFESVSKIRDTNNGDNWHELAKGNESARRAAEYVHMETDCFVPLGVLAQEWVGDLPQEWDQ